MAATTEGDIFMLSTQFMDPFGCFFQEPFSWELEELQKKPFLDVNEVDSIPSMMPLNCSSSPVEEEIEHKSPSLGRDLSFSAVSEELNSLTIDQQQLQSFPNSNNSPKKRAAPVLEQTLELDSKEGILTSSSSKDLYPPIDHHQDYSAMGLVFSGISSEVPSSSSRPFNHAMHRSHSLSQLQLRSSLNSSKPSHHHGSALDSTMQGLGSIAPSLTQLLEIDDHHQQHHHHQLEMKSPSCSSTSSSSSIRRVCSTGDLQRINEAEDEGGFKIGRYSLTERKERIHRYRQKRSERNFNKKIKYACRKTLADSRPRVRGRFAKNEDVVDSSSPAFIPLQQSRLHSGEFDDEVDVLLEDDERQSLLIDRQSSGELSESWGIRYVGR